ncbi:hypothetical protein IW262DRAFT_1302392 [Armillaria fumosa]|nr:hypothetical protein IW262DRAFT_1302392 [Armillaria fumosa]
MAPPGWCTAEQNAWFASRLASFHQACLDNKVGEFLAAAMKLFMVQWPLPQCMEEITGNTPEDVTKQAEQNKHYQKWKRGRFNNNRGKAHAALSAVTEKSIATSPKKKVMYPLQPQCHLRAVQIYSQHYYKIWVQAAIKKAIRLSLHPLSHGQKLTIINKLTHDMFQAETDESRLMRSKWRQPRKENEMQKTTLIRFCSTINAVPAVLNRFLKELALQMGWWFAVIAGGPDPADGGNIHTGSFHVALEVRAQQACNQADLEALNATLNNDNDEGDATPGMANLFSMPPSLSPAPIPSFSPPSTPTPVSPVPPSPSPTPAPIPSCPPPSTLTPGSPVSMPSTPAGAHPSSLIVPSHTDRMLPHSESGKDSTGDELDPQVWQDTMFGHDFFSMGTTEHDQLAYDNLLGHHAVFDYEGGSFPLMLHAMFGEDDDRAGDVDLGFSQEQDEYAQPEPESQLPLLPSPTWDAFDDHEIDADREEDAVTVDDKGGEDTERRMSKRARKPPASCAVIAAGWLLSAVQYLMDPNLGSDWLDLLAAWQILEALISQCGLPSKGRLGANTSRPSSLTTWLQN